jgi:hypothetical protein
MRKYAFELKIVPLDSGDYKLELWEPPPTDTRPMKGRKSKPLSSVQGWYLELATMNIRQALESNGYKFSELKRSRNIPFRLSEEYGIKLDLAFRGIQGVRKRTRLEDILFGIKEMGREEALYWHAKVSRNNGTQADNALIALRVLLGGQTR